MTGTGLKKWSPENSCINSLSRKEPKICVNRSNAYQQRVLQPSFPRLLQRFPPLARWQPQFLLCLCSTCWMRVLHPDGEFERMTRKSDASMTRILIQPIINDAFYYISPDKSEATARRFTRTSTTISTFSIPFRLSTTLILSLASLAWTSVKRPFPTSFARSLSTRASPFAT